MRPSASTTLDYEAMGEGLTFSTPPLEAPLEITGPVAAKLWLSSRTRDADVFFVVRVYDPQGKEVTFIGANDPRVPVAIGWLRASQRKLDAVLEANVVAEAKCGELRHALAQQTQELETRAATAAAREQEYLATIASLEASLITERAATAAVEQLADAAAEEAAAAHAASEAQLRKQGERLDAELRLALRRIAESDEATAAQFGFAKSAAAM
jgi:hypothetical protein